MKSLMVLFFSLFSLALSIFSFSNDLYAAWSQNLLVNSDAENGDVTGWISTDNFYATTSQGQTSGTVTAYEGSYFFSMAKVESDYGKAYQNVDISSYSSSVATGNIQIKAGMWVQNEYLGGTEADSCKFTLQYLDTNGVIIKEDTAGEIVHLTNYWSEQILIETIPANTKTIKYILEGFRYYGTIVNSFFDNTYLFIEDIGLSECTDSDNDGVPDYIDKCSDTPIDSWVNNEGCPASGLYTEEQMNQMVAAILTWGDVDGDGKITLVEAIKALRVTSGITEPAIK